MDLWPSAAAVIPAGEEAETFAYSVGSHLRQDDRGRLSVVLVDDQSADETTAAAAAASACASSPARILRQVGRGNYGRCGRASQPLKRWRKRRSRFCSPTPIFSTRLTRSRV